MKNKVWGYTRPRHSRGKYLLLGVITATALLWSITVVPAPAFALNSQGKQGQAAANTTVRHAEFTSVLHSSQSDGRISASPVEILNQVQDDRKKQRAEEKGLVLSLPFSVDSHWTSVSDTTPGIVWQTSIPSFAFQAIPTPPPLGRGGVNIIPLLPEEGLGEERVIKFGIQEGQFVPGEKTNTWFIYGWFGALEAIQQPYNVKYPEWGDRHNGIDFAGQEGIEVTSASVGTVIFAGKKIGNTVIVNAGNGYRITYGHLQDISVKRGNKVKIGDLIGHLGNTGTVNPHLHFQVDLIKKGSRTAINPLNLIENTDWSRVVVPNADANLFTTENQNPLTQPDFNW